MQRKCCAHCPGSVTRTGEPEREHACGVPVYVSGNLRVTSVPNGHACQKREERVRSANDDPSRDENDEPAEAVASCYERFATAKKFHAENLQHQPLPDRVDDAIFTRNARATDPCMCDAVKRFVFAPSMPSSGTLRLCFDCRGYGWAWLQGNYRCLHRPFFNDVMCQNHGFVVLYILHYCP